ncbi:MAG: L,D-transpeptidase family protein [Rhodopseudomonas sp.]|nr:L,D-transpeptidase family protein [Rhodopseudomonas sp.]
MRNLGHFPLPTKAARTAAVIAAAILAFTVAAPVSAFAAADGGDMSLRGALDNPQATASVAERLRALVTAAAFDKRDGRTEEHQAMTDFYAARQFAPLWLDDNKPTAKANAAIARLKDAAAEGLDPSDYPLPDFAALKDAEALADADVTLTQSVLTFARHLATGRIAPARVLAEVDYGDHTPDPARILARIAGATDIDAVFDNLDPTAERFKALKAKLADLRATASHADSKDLIPNGPTLRPGDRDDRVPLLRTRLGVRFHAARQTMRMLDPNTGRIELVSVAKPDSRSAIRVYDRALYNAVKEVQERADLKPNGIIDARTLAAINGPSRRKTIDTLIANMERWRWLPHDLGTNYVMVNIPDYSLRVMHDGQEIWNTKIVAGKPQTPTPLLSAAMDNVLVNPSWHVPQSIIQNELLPRYASDPHIFERLGLDVKRSPGGHITVVQPPGAANALGRIKFNFSNKYQVYLHDTPSKRLFAADKRAFSHGCMRVEDPTKFGEVILGLSMSGKTPNARQLSGMFGQKERVFQLTSRPSVHLTYQTAFVDDNGLELRDDIYGFDARIHAILNSAERRVADVAPPHDPRREESSPAGRQEILSRVERSEAANPMAYFERAFR